jgi:hypothetical protein
MDLATVCFSCRSDSSVTFSRSKNPDTISSISLVMFLFPFEKSLLNLSTIICRNCSRCWIACAFSIAECNFPLFRDPCDLASSCPVLIRKLY